jgi:uncharacterized protein with NAD-binding domain and iron-sulfur cluster
VTDRSAIVILGGGMAGVTAAFELSRHGWRDRFRSITLYQRGWLLGGKGASSRDADGRILEHGLHVWPGYYDNAFRVLRDCYDELDRPRTDPDCPIRTWGDAFVPAPAIGVFEHVGDDTIPWLAQFRTNDRLPGDPDARDDDLGDLARRLLGLAQDMARSAPGRVGPRVETGIDLALTVGRGIAADELLRGPGGFGRVDHEDFRAWLRRHGARSDTVDGGIVRGMYDLVFGYRDGEKATPAFAAGLGVFLAVRMFLDYKGALFWKMTAGMGEIVFAPFHQVLAARGVTLRYFHRVDGLELDAEGRALEAIRLTRQATPDGTDSYEPLDRHDDLPCFPARPRVAHAAAVPTEDRPVDDPGTPVILRRGQDFDTAVLAVSIGALPRIAAPLVRRLPEWRDMIRHVGTVGTHAAQVWLAPTEEELGWPAPGATLAGLEAPFDTCASMSHLLAREGWDAHGDRSPRSLAYLCSALPDGATRTDPDSTVRRFVREWSPALWPDAVRDGDGPVVRSVYTRVDADASDRYVQALPGSDAYRLRVDGSGVAHLVLAGDWTDCGLNAGCIEAAAISGIEAAAAVEGRPLTDRVLGPLTWDWP